MVVRNSSLRGGEEGEESMPDKRGYCVLGMAVVFVPEPSLAGGKSPVEGPRRKPCTVRRLRTLPSEQGQTVRGSQFIPINVGSRHSSGFGTVVEGGRVSARGEGTGRIQHVLPWALTEQSACPQMRDFETWSCCTHQPVHVVVNRVNVVEVAGSGPCDVSGASNTTHRLPTDLKRNRTVG